MTAAPTRRIPVGVLGATGAVGQTFIRLLADHPWFEVAAVAASERSAGKTYRDAAHWLGGEMSESVANLTVTTCDPARVDTPIVFSALDSDVAGEVEADFARNGRLVLSNARNYRMDADVPLVIAEVNPEHLGLIPVQRAARGWTGAIVTNSNCSTMVIALALAPLEQAFGIEHLFVTTMQALSGAGYPGVPSLDILGNVIPFIGGGEEEKIESEPLKILGTFEQNAITPARMRVSAQVNRVAVEHGHTACMSVKLASRATPEMAMDALRSWKGAIAGLGLPSAPEHPVIVTLERDRPQPRRDVNAGNGMSVVVGRVRTDPLLDLRLVAMGHNTIRGAAGASVLNAELMYARGFIEA